MNNPSAEASSKTVCIIGEIEPNNVEKQIISSVEDKISALGHTFQINTLSTNLQRLIEIVHNLKQLNKSGQLLAVLMILPENVIVHCSGPDYFEAWHDLLNEMNKVPAIIFVKEEQLFGVFTFQIFEKEFLYHKENISNSHKNIIENKSQETLNSNIIIIKNNIDLILKLISSHKKILNFRRKNELHMKLVNNYLNIKEYVKSLDRGMNPLFYADISESVGEINSILNRLNRLLLKENLEKIQNGKQLLHNIQASGIEIVPYQKKTEISIRVHHFLDEADRGVFLQLYVPNGRYQAEQLESFLQLFENYLQRVENLQFSIDIKKTRHGQIYVFKSKDTISTIDDMRVAISRFEIFMSLCQNDHKQAEAILIENGINSNDANFIISKFIKEYKRLELDSRHEYERKLLDLRQSLEDELLELTDGSSLPLIQSDSPSALLSFSNNTGPISINILGSSIGTNPIVEQTLNGDINYTSEDRQLIEMFKEYVEQSEAVRLKSDLELLKDNSAPEEERKTAKDKILGFLAKVAPEIGQVAVNVASAYLQKVLIGS